MFVTETIGLVAGLLTTLAFLPQVVKTVSTRSAGDFSILWLALFSSGLALWLVYGVWIGSLSLVLANGVTFVLVLVIAAVKLRERRA